MSKYVVFSGPYLDTFHAVNVLLPISAVVEDSTCIDKHPDCSIGVGYGYCSGSDSEIDYMKVNCQKSCKFCGSSKSKCEDKQTPPYCHQIKKLNHCRNPQYKEHFKKYCSATCGYCKRM